MNYHAYAGITSILQSCFVTRTPLNRIASYAENRDFAKKCSNYENKVYFSQIAERNNMQNYEDS